ncbi:MAG: TRAP transporter small permease subunit [Ilumatobacter sp.]|nr:TRAP transporter small permease subunit [Ilumatobacter sp.]
MTDRDAELGDADAHIEYVDDDDHGTDDERIEPYDDAEAVDHGLRPRGPVMTVLHGYRVAANRFAGLLGVISAFLIFPTVIISVVNVVLRRLGSAQGRNLTSNWLVEAQWYLYTLIFVFGLAHILRDSINVRVDFWFGNRSSRTQSWIDLVGHCIGLIPFAYIGIKYSWPAVKLSWENNEQSPDAGGLARYPIKTALMIGFVFLMIQGIAELIKNIEYLRGHEYRHESDDPALAGGQKLSVEDFAVDEFAPLLGGVSDETRGT